jgi:hypothetical protein
MAILATAYCYYSIITLKGHKMREFIIKSLDILIWVVGGIIAIGGIGMGLFALMNG